MKGRGLGSRLLDFAEGFAPVSQVEVVSCRTDLFPKYKRRGYTEVRRRPLDDHWVKQKSRRKSEHFKMHFHSTLYIIPQERLTRRGLQMVVMQKGGAHAVMKS